MLNSPVVTVVVQQHVEEAAHLSSVRAVLLRAPHVKLLQLSRIDERIAAHLDGLVVAGPAGTAMAHAELERLSAGTVFTVAASALAHRDAAGFRDVLPLASADDSAWRGLARALGWTSASDLQGIVRELLQSNEAGHRCLGLAACRMHQVDPGLVIDRALGEGVAPEVCAAALRTAAELGRRDVLPRVRELLSHDHPDVARWAARAACLLGKRGAALDVLQTAAFQHDVQALLLFMAAAPHERAEALAKGISQAARAESDDPRLQRLLLRTVGLLGDVRLIPWLIERMTEPRMMRLAGEAFTWITGADLAWLDLEGDPVEAGESGPNDDPEDENVDMDEDDSLPWPDQAKVQAWWTTNAQRFQPGVRYFMGAPPTWEHCLQVLNDGCQRQRFAAAPYLCLLRPGTPLFNCAAPAWRQKRLLAKMS